MADPASEPLIAIPATPASSTDEHSTPCCCCCSRPAAAAPAPQINDSLLRGDIDTALALAEQEAPGSLEAHPRVLFRLRCQKFIGLVSVWGAAVLYPQV